MTDLRVVLVTAPRGEPAARIARDLVDSRLAACVNIVPGVRSIYRWEGRVCDDGEDLLMAKTPADRVEALTARVREIHPYTVPEVVALAVDSGNAAYLAWALAETR